MNAIGRPFTLVSKKSFPDPASSILRLTPTKSPFLGNAPPPTLSSTYLSPEGNTTISPEPFVSLYSEGLFDDTNFSRGEHKRTTTQLCRMGKENTTLTSRSALTISPPSTLARRPTKAKPPANPNRRVINREAVAAGSNRCKGRQHTVSQVHYETLETCLMEHVWIRRPQSLFTGSSLPN